MTETGPPEAFGAAFSDRLTTLSRARGLLPRSGRCGSARHRRGPEVVLRPFTVKALAPALHELATNARKHGALSHDVGRLAVTRWTRAEAGERRLVIAWIETGLGNALSASGVHCAIDLAVRPRDRRGLTMTTVRATLAPWRIRPP